MLANDPSVTVTGVRVQTGPDPVMDNYLERAIHALTASTHIMELDLSFCFLRVATTAAAAPFAEWIKSCATLKKLRLSCFIYDRQILQRHLLPVFLHAVSSRVAQGRQPLESVSISHYSQRGRCRCIAGHRVAERFKVALL
jgi:hypothetical protein